MFKHLSMASATALLALLCTPANAAPGVGLDGIQAPLQAEKIDYRRCWRSGGRRVCRYYRSYEGYDYGPGYYGPGFYGPGFGLYFGGGGFRGFGGGHFRGHGHHGHR